MHALRARMHAISPCLRACERVQLHVCERASVRAWRRRCVARFDATLLMRVLGASQQQLVAAMFPLLASVSASGIGEANIQSAMAAALDACNGANCRFVRCLRPNKHSDEAKRLVFDRPLVHHQLATLQLYETLKLRYKALHTRTHARTHTHTHM